MKARLPHRAEHHHPYNALVSGAETRETVLAKCILVSDPNKIITPNGLGGTLRAATEKINDNTPITDNAAESAAESQEEKMDSVKAQRAYVEKLKEQKFDFSLVVGDAFIRGMRDIGYKHTGTALDEDIDNSIEAGAENVLIQFGGMEGNKPTKIAVIDDGSGMEHEMLRAAILWGASHRENNRTGFGRYGFGLPSSSISIGRRFEVYSKLAGGDWYMSYIDLDQISDGTFYKEDDRLKAPPAKQVAPPDWVKQAMKARWESEDLEHGTVVLIEKVDRLTWKTAPTLERELLEHFGTIYRNYLRNVNIYVNEKLVESVDPLFLDSSARFYDKDGQGNPLNSLRAVSLDPISVPIRDDNKKVIGTAKVRLSYLPAGFQTESGRVSDTKLNPRFRIMKENNGIIVLRAGRQIDVVRRNPWFTFQNNDRNIKIEIDFPPTLDEEFSISTTKQQIVISDRIWAALEQRGVKRAIMADLRKRRDQDYVAKRAEEAMPEEEEPRLSEQIMAETLQYQTKIPEVSPEETTQREKRFEERVQEVAKVTGKTAPEAKKVVEREVKERPFKISFETSPEAPFYRVEAIGTQVHVIVNMAHPFFSDLYLESTPQLQAQLELLLFVMSKSELDSQKERKRFYMMERSHWSNELRLALSLYDERDSRTDRSATRLEALEVEAFGSSGDASTQEEFEFADEAETAI
jgi:hypothetical protein